MPFVEYADSNMLDKMPGMAYFLKTEPHPLGVVVIDEEHGARELLIEGERCCGVPFEELRQIAATTRQLEVAENAAVAFRLRNL